MYLSQNTAPIKSPNTYSNLSRYNETKKPSQSVPYIAAVFNINDGRFQVFTLGDGMNYSKPRAKGNTSEVGTYYNVPLKENGTYRVFQRFFKNKVYSFLPSFHPSINPSFLPSFLPNYLAYYSDIDLYFLFRMITTPLIGVHQLLPLIWSYAGKKVFAHEKYIFCFIFLASP